MRDVDRIIELVRNVCPSVEVKQLKVLHPREQMTMAYGISINPKASFKSK